MAEGFRVVETIDLRPEVVWDYLTDFSHAQRWMTGIDAMSQITQGPLEVGTRLKFTARGKERESRVTVFEPGNRIALTSTQGGVTATYTYSLAAVGDSTEVTLDAACRATGIWKLLHPVIVLAMKKSDSSHLARLKAAITRRD